MDYAYTLQFAFEYGPKRLRFLSKYAKKFVNVTIGTMQMAFCMVYLVFIGKRYAQIQLVYLFIKRTWRNRVNFIYWNFTEILLKFF